LRHKPPIETSRGGSVGPPQAARQRVLFERAAMVAFHGLLISGFLLLWAAPASAMRFAVQYNGGNCIQCAWVLAEGFIEPGTTTKFRRFTIDNREALPKLVRFDSSGGDLIEAMQFGRYLRESGFDTIVAEDTAIIPGHLLDYVTQTSKCFDACVYAFLGGVHRYAAGRSLAAHQLPGPRNSVSQDRMGHVDLEQLRSALSAYVRSMGVDPRLATVAATGSAVQGTHVFSRQELTELNVDNSSLKGPILREIQRAPNDGRVNAIDTRPAAKHPPGEHVNLG
jgi:hypothetical protein